MNVKINNNESFTVKHSDDAILTVDSNKKSVSHCGTASGDYSHAEGYYSEASGDASHAEGAESLALGENSHAEGKGNSISGSCAKDGNTFTLADSGTWDDITPSACDIVRWKESGIDTWAKVVSSTSTSVTVDDGGASSGDYDITIYLHAAVGEASHIGGTNNIALNDNQTVIGKNAITDTSNLYAFVIGNGSSASSRGNAFGIRWDGSVDLWNNGTVINLTPSKLSTLVSGTFADKSIYNNYAIPEGTGATISSNKLYINSSNVTEGLYTQSTGSYSHAEGKGMLGGSGQYPYPIYVLASGEGAHAEGVVITGTATASGKGAHIEGGSCTASGNYSHSQGKYTSATKEAAHSEGESTTSDGFAAHAEGFATETYNTAAHSEGYNTVAYQNASHAEGKGKKVLLGSGSKSGKVITLSYLSGHIPPIGEAIMWKNNSNSWVVDYIESFTEGSGNNTITCANNTESFSSSSIYHVEAITIGEGSHVGGIGNIATSDYQRVIGKYSSIDRSNNYALIVGNGTSSSARSNAFAVRWNGSVDLWDNGTVVTITPDKLSYLVNGTFADGNVYGKDLYNQPKITGSLGIGASPTGQTGQYSLSQGNGCNASGSFSSAMGRGSAASGTSSSSEGDYTSASGTGSHSEGDHTASRGYGSHSEGRFTISLGNGSHSEGNRNLALGEAAHSEGTGEYISGTCTKSGNTFTLNEGTWGAINPAAGDVVVWLDNYTTVWSTVSSSTSNSVTVEDGGSLSGEVDVKVYFHAAIGNSSHVGGTNNITLQDNQTIIGKNALKDTSNDFAFAIGNGASADSRSNAFAIGWDGSLNVWDNGTKVSKTPAQMAAMVIMQSISQANYDALVQAGTVDANTLYIITS